jgi:hypothetical protein
MGKEKNFTITLPVPGYLFINTRKNQLHESSTSIIDYLSKFTLNFEGLIKITVYEPAKNYSYNSFFRYLFRSNCYKLLCQ